MKALQLEQPLHWKQIDIPEPGKPGPDDALVRVHNVGVCGTDLSGYLGKMPFFSYPRIPGHELGVEVVAVGANVTNVKPGDRCSVEPYINDPNSYASRRGHPNCCEKLQVLGVHCDGGLRPLFNLPARKLHPSTKLQFEQLALVETLAIGCHAVDRGSIQKNETCMVIGAGPIGLAVLEFVKLIGCQIIVVDTQQSRLDFVKKKLGITNLFRPSDKLDAQLRELCDGHLPDVVIDATGSNMSMAASFNLVASAGRVVYVGITTSDITFKHPPFHRVEGTLLCSRNALPRDFTRIIRLIEEGTIDTGPWITHRTPFEQVIEVFPSFTQPETGVIKAVISV